MDVLAILLACSVHADDALMSSLAYVHSRGSPFVVVNVRPQALDELADTNSLPSAAAARLEVTRILSAGGVPALGLLPVLPAWAAEFGRTLDDLLDPCGDVAVASAKLSEFDYACRGQGKPKALRRRICALDLYGRALDLPALRRAVLADLTVQNPSSGDNLEGNEATMDPVALASNSGLFFAVSPAEPPPWFKAPFSSPRPEERP